MTQKQIERYEKLSKVKSQLTWFLKCADENGDIAMHYYNRSFGCSTATVYDDEFKKEVMKLAKERLKEVERQIEEI